jgi:hypothetical protein
MSSIYLDIETAPIDNADQFIEEPEAPSNYKDPAKIAAYIAEAKQIAVAKCALDFGLLRIVAIGIGHFDERGEPMVNGRICKTTDGETAALVEAWARCEAAFKAGGMVVGYNLASFDIPAMITRSWILGVRPAFDAVRRYGDPHVLDLMSAISFNDPTRRKRLAWWAKRMGWTTDDTHSGAEVPALVAAGDWNAVADHVTSDVRLTMRLHQMIGGGRVGWNTVAPEPLPDDVL